MEPCPLRQAGLGRDALPHGVVRQQGPSSSEDDAGAGGAGWKGPGPAGLVLTLSPAFFLFFNELGL